MSGLQKAFEDFKAGKACLKSIHEDTIACFKKIQDQLAVRRVTKPQTELQTVSRSPPASPSSEYLVLDVADVHLGLDLADVLYAETEKAEVERLFTQDPALIVIGQTNCGKSSIVNELLGMKVLPTSDRPCTARIVRVTYSETPQVKLQARDGRELKRKELRDEKARVPRSMIELSKADREDSVMAGASVVVQLNVDFLKAGVDVIDCPGKNENNVLDNLVNEQLENVLPCVIYVVDGHNLFTSQDRTALEEIKKQNEQLEIFYVVSKIDPEDRMSSEDEDDEEEERKAEESIQENKKRRVMEKLVKLRFLPNDEAVIKERLHGLSAWKINEWNKLRKQNPTSHDPDLKEYMEDFRNFIDCLQIFYKETLLENIQRVASMLIAIISRCLEFFIQKANILHNENMAIIAMLEKAKKDEAEVHEAIIRDLEAREQDVKEVLRNRFKEGREDFLKVARELEYDSTDIEDLSEDGFVKGEAAKKACERQIMYTVMTRVETEMAEALQLMFQSKDEYAKKLEDQMRSLEEETKGNSETPSTVSRALAQGLVTSYNLQVAAPSATSAGLFRSFFSKIGRVCRAIFRKGGWKMMKEVMRNQFEVGSSEWKETTAVRVLKSINTDQVTKDIIQALKEHFVGCHDKFAEGVQVIITLCKRGENVRDEQRETIRKLAPDVAMLEMLAYNVRDGMKFGAPECGVTLGGGAQGTVYACKNILSPAGKFCVVKVVPVSDAEQMKDLMLELHNTRSLSHKNILPLLCTSISGSESQGFRVSLVSERMRCDLHEALPTLHSLRTRLTIALEVAEALQYLHKQGMVHRDVKTQNVLLDETNHAKLTDLGLCKPEGLMTGSVVGTPLSMAPEMIARKYDKSVDVYAFGVLLWHICEGKGNLPKNVRKHFNPLVMLVLNAVENKTPERLEEFTESCWELMEKCWSAGAEDRPSFDVVLEDLQRILEDPEIS